VTRAIAANVAIVVLALGSVSACGVGESQAPRTGSEATADNGSCPILANWSSQTYRGYSVATDLGRGQEMAPGAVLVDCSSSQEPTGATLSTFRIKGVDPAIAFLVDEYTGVVFLSVPPAQAPEIVRNALG
jgi:hypothetical protein